MISASNSYGFTNTSSSSPCYTGNFKGVGGTLCSDPNSYVFWDTSGHLTGKAHAILGNAITSAVPLPAAMWLLISGLLGLATCTKCKRS